MVVYAVLAVCLLVMLVQLPRMFSKTALHTQPARKGPVDTDAVTDQCIHNLWQVLNRLQTGSLDPDQIRCPATGKPYRVTRLPHSFLIQCPNPGAHGVSAVRVKTDSPVPEVVP